MEMNAKKIKRLLGFGKKEFDKRIVIATCRVCGEPILGVPFLDRYRKGKLKLREKLVIKNILTSARLGLKAAKLVNIEASHLSVGNEEKDVLGGIFSYHFAFKKDKKHKKVKQQVIDYGNSTPITSNIEWNQELKKEWGLDADW